MRILVTGGAGFLGSHLCESLLKDGHEVVCLDNFYTGSTHNVSHLINNRRFTILQHDVTNPISISVDGIFNMACPASPIHYQKDPIQTLKTSVIGALNLLYGDPLINPQPEEYWGNTNPFGIRSCYDEGKRAAETLFHDFRSTHNTDIRVARIFNTFGPRMAINDGRVISNYIVQALLNDDLTVYGTGEQTRSFCYVTDLIDGLKKLFFTLDVFTPINLGNPTPISMLELANEIVELTESKSKIKFLRLPEDDPKIREPNISRAKNLLKWKPMIDRRDGILQTIEYFKRASEN